MKHTVRIIAILLVTAVIFEGCVSSSGGKITKLEDLEGKTVAFMSIPIPAESTKTDVEEKAGVTLKEVAYYDSFQAAVSALKSGKADAVMAQRPVSDYYVARDDTLAAIPLDVTEGATYHMAVRAEDTELLGEINAALASFAEDGTLDALAQEFITDLTPEKQLEGRPLQYFDDAPTLYVGLSGDNPPIDYIAADGQPAGYNVELLALLGEALRVNFEISVTPLETKFAALASKKIDIFFIHPVVNNMNGSTTLITANKNIALSEAYCESESNMLLVLK